jgi:glycerol-3-phosphate dehydrogenase
MNREHHLERLRQDPKVSVLIIGAGINGIATFRDLALQGVDVLLVDREDFCSGASAASSHMIHGGIRYLENGEFRLVREAVHERNNLLQNAPHAVKPLPTTIPVYKWFSGIFNAPLKFLRWVDKPSERGALVIKLGLMMYDAFTRRQATVPKHRWLFRKPSLQNYPQLNPAITSTATYYDAMVPSPERLSVELVLDGEAASENAVALNYMKAMSALGDTVTLQDGLSDEEILIEPEIVVNAAGPWIDLANRSLGQETRMIGGTKGSHLILDHPELRDALGGHEFFFENKDGRIVLIYPLLDKVLVGTSDIRIEHPDEARCTDEEVDYFLEMIRHVFPAITVDRSQIVFRFSGVRPLPHSGASRTGHISRDHKIEVIEPEGERGFPILCLIGGKWTTFRAFSEHVTDTILERLRLNRVISTEKLPIGGGANHGKAGVDWLGSLSDESGLPQERIAKLFARYGTRVTEIALFLGAEEDLPLKHHAEYSRREIQFLAQGERVVHLDDLVLRRSNLAMLGELTAELLIELAQVLSESLGWSAVKVEQEVDRTRSILEDKHSVFL